VIHEALVATDKILLPPIHIKLELVKLCVKALDHTSDSWQRIPYILESNPHPNLICTNFDDFLSEKKKLVRGSNPHFSFNRPLPTRQTDSVMSDDGETDE